MRFVLHSWPQIELYWNEKWRPPSASVPSKAPYTGVLVQYGYSSTPSFRAAKMVYASTVVGIFGYTQLAIPIGRTAAVRGRLPLAALCSPVVVGAPSSKLSRPPTVLLVA